MPAPYPRQAGHAWHQDGLSSVEMALKQGFLSVLGKVSRYVYVAGR